MPRLLQNKIACATLLTLAFTGSVLALSSDRYAEFDIQSDRFDSSLADKTRFMGNVHIRQGSLDIQSDNAEVSINDAGEFTAIHIEGKPATLSQELDNNEGRLDATAQNIDYQLAEETIVLTGDVRIKTRRGEYSGQTIRYNMASGNIDGGQGQAGDRVHIRLKPANSPDTP